MKGVHIMGIFSAYAAKKKWMTRFKRLAGHVHKVSGDDIISLTDAFAIKTFLFVGSIVDTKNAKEFNFLQNDHKMEKESIAFLAFMVENYIEYYWDAEASEVQKEMIIGNYYKKISYLAEKEYGMESYFADQIFRDRVSHYKAVSPCFPMNRNQLREVANEFYNVTEFTKQKKTLCLLDMSLKEAPFQIPQVVSTLDFFINVFEPSVEDEINACRDFDIIGVGLRETSDMSRYMFL